MNKAKNISIELLKYISGSSLRAGDILPPERKLAEMFSSSRNSTREAIRIIETYGIIEIKRGSGSYIKNRNGIDDCISFLSEDHTVIARQKLQARLLIEPVIVSNATEHITGDALKELEGIVIRLSNCILKKKYDQVVTEDRLFHRNLIKATGNSVLLHILGDLEIDQDVIQKIIPQLSERELESIFAKYVEVLMAIKSRKKDNTEAVIRESIINRYEIFSRYLKESIFTK